jgi:hypothetical protein
MMTALGAGRKTVILAALSLFSGAAWAPRPAAAGEFTMKPTLSLSEEYNDNVDASAANRRTDYITHLQPGLALHYLSAGSVWDAAYNPEYIKFARGTKEDEFNHRGVLNGSAALIGNFLFLDLSDTLSRVSLDVARDVTKDSVFVNQVDQNLATVSPYLMWRYAEKGSLKTGYSYTDVRYWNAGSSGGVDRRQQDATAELNYEIRPKLSLSAQYGFSSVQSQAAGYDSHSVSGGVKYQYADGSSFFGSLGNSWQIFSGGQRVSSLFWDVGFTHDFRALVATLESKVSVNTDPQSVSNRQASLSIPTNVDPLSISTKMTTHSARLERKFERGTVGLSGSYSRYAENQTGGAERTTTTLGALGSCEVSPSLTASLSATGDRVTGLAPGDFPYHFTGIGALSYAFNHDLTAGLSYTRVIYRLEPASGSGSVDVNRVVLTLNKAF